MNYFFTDDCADYDPRQFPEDAYLQKFGSFEDLAVHVRELALESLLNNAVDDVTGFKMFEWDAPEAWLKFPKGTTDEEIAEHLEEHYHEVSIEDVIITRDIPSTTGGVWVYVERPVYGYQLFYRNEYLEEDNDE